MAVVFCANVEGTSFIAPAMDLLYPFAPSPAGPVLTPVCSTDTAPSAPASAQRWVIASRKDGVVAHGSAG